jgi:tetratricopeptide (TPR) repeat protein
LKSGACGGSRQSLTELFAEPISMYRLIIIITLACAALWSQPALAQSRSQLGPLCTTDTTPADAQIDACNKIIALKVFSGQQLATIYFWRAVGWNKKGNYVQVIADTTEAIRLAPNQPSFNLRGSAYYDRGEYDIAIADFNDALRIGSPNGIIFHNRGNAFRGKGDYAKAVADYDASIKSDPTSPFSWQNRGICKQALGDLDGALADINETIRLAPALPQPLTSRAVIWRAKGDFDRAISDGTEAIRLAKNPPPNIMTPPGSVMISAFINRALSYEAKGDYEHARADFTATLQGSASDAASNADADPRPRRGRCDHQEHAGAVVELVAAQRGLSRRQVTAVNQFANQSLNESSMVRTPLS